MKRNPRRRAIFAFTLVELLVVIGIIAVLIGILLPTLAKARESAVMAQCMSNLHQFAVADQMYVNQYNFHMPGWWNDQATNNPSAFNAYNRYWAGIPEFRKAMSMPILDGEPAPDPNFKPTVFRCYVTSKWFCRDAARAELAPSPTDPVTHQAYWPIHYSYGMNVMGVDVPNTSSGGGLGGGAYEPGSFPDVWDVHAAQADPKLKPIDKIFHGFKPSQVRRPADKLHFADAMYFVLNVYGVGPNTGGYPGWHSQISNYDQVGERTGSGTLPSGGAYDSQRSIAWRHKGGANVVFFDGHGEWMRKDRLYNKDASGNIIRNDALWLVMQ
jgi:prepilin-type processing-associated H-X9-DG protein